MHLTAYAISCIHKPVKLIKIYKCLCDKQRLRILNLLKEGPLCVCHLMDILETEQFKISKQLRYMKDQGVVESKRNAQWMIYRLADNPHPVLTKNLMCLQDSITEHPQFKEDLDRRKEVINEIRQTGSTCSAIILLKT